MAEGERIDLAQLPPFRIGQLTLDPPIRQIRRDDGAEEVVEPRVMQVLIALAQDRGKIVTRHMLGQSCWDGRIVGEDAINRVISRLRRVAEGLGANSFTLETITKVGYRLHVVGEGEAAPFPAGGSSPPPDPGRTINRRRWIAGAGSTAVAAIGGGIWFLGPRRTASAPSPQIAALMDQARLAVGAGTIEGSTNALGLYRRVVALQPDYAEGWGALAQTYAQFSHFTPPEVARDMAVRAREAIAHALALDPNNLTARLAESMLLPIRGNWRAIEQACRAVLTRRPNDLAALTGLARTLFDVGRCREAAEVYDRAAAIAPQAPSFLYMRCQCLWAAGRLEEADRATEEAYGIAPLAFQVWFTRFYLLLYTARIRQAIAMAEDVPGRPGGIPSGEFDEIIQVARAMQTRERAQTDAVERMIVESAHHGSGKAENSMQFASTLGRLDAAFAIADAYYFGRGFETGTTRFAAERVYQAYSERNFRHLFLPSTQAMRTDRRFEPLLDELGLEKYWRDSGSRPDFRG